METTINSVDASDLGWEPGVWPESLEWTGRLYWKTERMFGGGDLLGYRYVSAGGSVLIVVND